MAGQTDLGSGPTGNTPVPDLIERYKVRRDAWIAQADELARLRDEVRGSAEREALEIVTAARRDVRRVIMEARRELLVLSAQVQAALGESAPKNEPPALLTSHASIASEVDYRPALTSGPPQITFVPEAAVDEILNEVRADMTALAKDARALPLQAVATTYPIAVQELEAVAEVTAVPATTSSATTTIDSKPTEFAESPYFAAVASPVEASKPWLPSWLPSDSVPVSSDRRLTLLVGAFAVTGVLVGATTFWWLFSRGGEDGPSRADVAATAPPSAAEPAPASTAASSAETSKAVLPSAVAPGNLLVVAEAVRDVWVRTTVDGRVDDGRTLVAGQIINLSADQSISLRVGDAGAMRVSVNRGDRQVLGSDGQVVTRNYFAKRARPEEGVTPLPVEAATEPTGSRTAGAPSVATQAPFPSTASQPTAAGVNPPAAQNPSATPVAPPQAAVPTPPPNPIAPNAPPASASATGQITPLAAPPLPPPSSTSGLAPAPSVAATVVAAARQWLDAYHRQDRAAMAALSMENLLLADERGAEERFPAGAGNVTRTLDRVNVQVAADTAVLTAVMMEQSGAQPARVSPISQVWVLAGGGQWKVRQARFVSETRLNQVFR